MQIHYGKHHPGLREHLNAALDKHPALYRESLDALLRGITSVPEDIRTRAQQRRGHHNHSQFWNDHGAGGHGRRRWPGGALADAIKQAFGGFAPFKEQLSTAGTTRFGSGWAWLAVASGKLEVFSTANQDSPLMEGKTPVLGLDVWEHAYYLNIRTAGGLVAAWWNVLTGRRSRGGMTRRKNRFSRRAAP